MWLQRGPPGPEASARPVGLAALRAGGGQGPLGLGPMTTPICQPQTPNVKEGPWLLGSQVLPLVFWEWVWLFQALGHARLPLGVRGEGARWSLANGARGGEEEREPGIRESWISFL